MKSIKHKILLIASALVFFAQTGCDEFLDTQPYAEIDREIAFRSIEDFESAVSGLYNSIRSGSYWGRSMISVPEMMTDNVVQGIRNNGAFTQIHYWNHNSFSGEFGGIWAAAYRVIFNANSILENTQAFEGSFIDDADNIRLREIQTEALIARAMAHFDLVRCFAKPYRQSDPANDLGVAIVLGTVFQEVVGRNTIQEVYDQVESDLREAANLLATIDDIDTNTGVSDLGERRGKFTKGVLYALWSRVAFEKGDWGIVEEMSSNVISYSNDSYSMDNDLSNIWETSASNEIILQMYMISQDGPPRIGWDYVSQSSTDYVASASLLSSFQEKEIDNRYNFYFTDSVNLQGLAVESNDPIYVIKHRTSERLFEGQNNAKVFRLAEIYLNRAEARVYLGTGDAEGDLNVVRIARGLNSETLTGNRDQDLQKIRFERRKEMAFEGDWWFYQRSNGSGQYRFGADCQQTDAQDCVLEWNGDRQDLMTFPIPQGEMDANTGMTQNPGY